MPESQKFISIINFKKKAFDVFVVVLLQDDAM